MSKLKPAIICGGVLGVLLVLTALLVGLTKIQYFGCCNCVWPIAAGLLATLMFIKGSSSPAKVSDGAVVGLLAGLVAGFIYLVVGGVLQYFVADVPAMEAQIHQLSPNFPLSGVALLVVIDIVGFFIFAALSLLGGIIAIPIFEKRKDQMEPPPPPPFQGYGGGQAA